MVIDEQQIQATSRPAVMSGGRIEAGENSTWSPGAAAVYRDVRAAMHLPTAAGWIAARIPRATEGVSPTADADEFRKREALPALAAIEDLRRWLNISYDEVASIAGWSSPSIIFYWRRRAAAAGRRSDNRLPRPRAQTVFRLFKVHALLSALGQAIGGEDSHDRAVQLWARSDLEGVQPLELLRSGQADLLEARVSRLLFSTELPADAFSNPRYADSDAPQSTRQEPNYSGSFDASGDADEFE